jgi:hypothetical protein
LITHQLWVQLRLRWSQGLIVVAENIAKGIPFF